MQAVLWRSVSLWLVSRRTPRRAPPVLRPEPDPAGRGAPAELRSDGTGTAGSGDPGTWHRDSPQPGVERASALQGGVSSFFPAVLWGEPRTARLLLPRGWGATKHALPRQVMGTSESQPPPHPQPQYSLHLRVHDK